VKRSDFSRRRRSQRLRTTAGSSLRPSATPISISAWARDRCPRSTRGRCERQRARKAVLSSPRRSPNADARPGVMWRSVTSVSKRSKSTALIMAAGRVAGGDIASARDSDVRRCRAPREGPSLPPESCRRTRTRPGSVAGASLPRPNLRVHDETSVPARNHHQSLGVLGTTHLPAPGGASSSRPSDAGGAEKRR